MRRSGIHEETLRSGRSAAGDKEAARRKRGVKAAPGGDLRDIYGRLLRAFGRQGWWPVSRGRSPVPLYRPGDYGPHGAAAMFEICAGAILTQNTAWNNARTALAELKKAGMLSPAGIARTGTGRLGTLIRSSGFFRQKAGRLKGFVRHMLDRHPEGLREWFSSARAEVLRAELLALDGIGPETADSMLLYAGGKTKFVVDAYTQRIFLRLGLLRGGYGELQAAFESGLPADFRVYNEYHALIVALGKAHCRKTRPLCGGCPLLEICGYAKKEDRDKTGKGLPAAGRRTAGRRSGRA